MEREQKKAASAAFKERKVFAGLFVVRCSVTDQSWVGRAPNLATIGNRLEFSLRQGVIRNAELQAAWRAHGPESITWEELERIDDDTPAYLADQQLRQRHAYWCAVLNAEKL